MDSTLMRSVEGYVEDVWEDVVADIAALVAHPSVADAAAGEDGAPFGRPVREALDHTLRIAEHLGYEVSDDAGYVGMADIPGEVDTQIAAIAHIDVVPAGPGWNTDPFTMERREGWLLGRGVIDDKGPAVLALYAGAYLLRHGITPHHTFRTLIGCDEEVGMSDVHHYLATHDDPAFLFTPDAEFPVCNAEKGQFGCYFKSAELSEGAILHWSGAEAPNAIPSQSICELAVDAAELPAPNAHAGRIRIEAVGERRARIVAQGIGGHASLPAGTLNAVALMVGYLREAEEAYAAAGKQLLTSAEHTYVEFLAHACADSYGGGLGIACESPAFGPLTSNVGCIDITDGRLSASLDVRFPDNTSVEDIAARLQPLMERYGITMDIASDKPPFSVSADSAPVQALLDVYREVTGKAAEPFSMGGGTYARNFARAVSFGPEDNGIELPAWAGTMHGPNEAASEQLLKDALKMYILALVRLDELEL